MSTITSRLIARGLAAGAILAGTVLAAPSAQAQGANAPGWSGNFAFNPGFEEDFVNMNAESHVLSFKGDWYYNQQDFIPDYWTLAGAWSWSDANPRSGKRTLKLPAGATARQTYFGASFHDGGGPWSAAPVKDMTVNHADRLLQPWRITVWCRGGGIIDAGGVKVEAPNTPDWSQVTVDVPVDKVAKNGSMTVVLSGPGEFDDLVAVEKLPDTVNLLGNGTFEAADKDGAPLAWGKQQKFDWIGPTYYVWTDWMHSHEPNRGKVVVDPLVAFSGRQSLRFDVYPGDEKFVESAPITLNQTQPNIIEVSAMVRADRIKMIDIRAVDEDGANLPSAYPIQPEYSVGGTALYGNGTFGWRYIRKYFALPFNEPVKNIRVRLAARGFNGNTLEDAGTRSYASQSGTLWWDDVRVVERTSTAAELAARGVKAAAATAGPAPTITGSDLDLGERRYGQNTLKLALTNAGAAGPMRLRLTTTLPGGEPVVTESKPVTVAAGARGTLEVPYRIDKLAGDIKKQGTLRVELLRGTAVASDTTYAFNTWPVIVDFDVARHYNLPEENPVTTSINLGVSDTTLAQVAKLEIELKSNNSNASYGLQTITNLKQAFEQTRAALPKSSAESFEYGMPTPAWWVDRTNLIITKLDLGKMKVWPHNNPVRDTVVEVRGLDAAGKVLFSDRSDGISRVAQRPAQEAIKTVKVREDGAILVNDKPRYLMGASHQQIRVSHSPELQAKLGLSGLRLVNGDSAKFDVMQKMWKDLNLYVYQAKAVSGGGSTEYNVELTPAQKAALEAYVKANGMENILSMNTGGWESHIPNTPEDRAKHQITNEWIKEITQRPTSWSPSGAYNAWWINDYPYYDIVHGETEMWGPMDFNTIFLPEQKRLRKSPTAWVYLPQLYDNTPYERYRFETYENIIRGAAGVEMIQGIGDPTFNRGLAGELRYLEEPLNSLEKAPAITLEPSVSHKITRHKGKTYVLATNSGPITIGDWKWNSEIKQSGKASHEGDSVNRMWMRPAGMRIHGFRGLPMPEMVQAGDKLVQYVWIDPAEKPDWALFAVRGDGKFSHAGVVGNFDYEKFRNEYGNVFMFSELEHSVWHQINYVMDPPTYESAVKLMGKAWADGIKKTADAERAGLDKKAYKAADFKKIGALPAAGQWVRLELTAEQLGLVGRLVDGFAYMTQNGRALWDYSVLERGGKVVRVFNEDTVGIDRTLLDKVRINVPGLKAGAKVKALFENREIVAEAGGFVDNMQGVDTYGYEAGAVTGDMFGYAKDDNREIPRMMPSGYGYSYGPTAVRIYEIEE